MLFLFVLHHQEDDTPAIEQRAMGETKNQNLNRRITNGDSHNSNKYGERQLGENRVVVIIVADVATKVYDNNELLLLVSKPK
ncbi:hypothetical protein MUK42_13948 [Musa troglodytarum]|uniref:Uncharacterized protein n=1 Tax=Musa troglodytarum TaxID=320322 RepID=A0A9E7I282_9LILI|nr:hypothetical protein MUK42_13948 [Musa troglodytarum]